MIQPNWSVTHNIGDTNHRATFELDRDKLLMAVKDKTNQRGQRYLENSSESIDFYEVFEDYRRRVTAFHSWFAEAANSVQLEVVRDYERCLRENKKFATRTFWNLMIGNWLNWNPPPDPYDHLHRYLTPEQLEAISKLPMKSKQQIDKIIEIVDVDSACDDELRNRIYRLFGE